MPWGTSSGDYRCKEISLVRVTPIRTVEPRFGYYAIRNLSM